MTSLTNRVQLIGNLGANPEMKKFESGSQMCSFNLATNSSFKNAKGEKMEETQWHRIVTWGKLAEYICNNIEKGTRILVDGRLETRSYKDDEGVQQYITQVIGNEVVNLSYVKDKSQEEVQASTPKKGK